MTDNQFDLTVVVPVTERFSDPKALYDYYKKGIEATGKRYEFIYVLDGDFPSVQKDIGELKDKGEPITIIKLAKWFGEATAISIGQEYAKAEILLTLPAYYQIEAEEIPKMLDALEGRDLVVAHRYPRIDSFFNRVQSGLFNALLKLLINQPLHDVGCGVRVLRRQVLEEVHLYGDQHRFLPALAFQKGFKIHELPVKQSQLDAHTRVYRPGVYIRRLLDLLTIFFLIKFTKKPLRFFGLMGSAVFLAGVLSMVYLIFERLILGVALADRPAMLFSALLIVLGIQIFAIGLVGEIVIFTHAKDIKEYTIEEIIN